MKYKSKPVVIEAIQWTGRNLSDILAFCPIIKGTIVVEQPWEAGKESPGLNMTVHTPSGVCGVEVGDYIVKGIGGEFYSCKPDIFEQAYKEVTDDL